MTTLARAIEIAARAHAGRIGEDGEPEILHPLRVMLRLQHDAERQVAILHDVIEDGGLTPADLEAAGFSAELVSAVEALTGRAGEPYDDYIERVARHPLAARVKQADVKEHMVVVSGFAADEARAERLDTYRRARVRLAEALARGG